MKRILLLIAAVHFSAAFGNVWDKVTIKGVTDKENPVAYRAGEPIVLSLVADNVPPDLKCADYFFEWKRTGDDGKVERATLSQGLSPWCPRSWIFQAL